MNLDIFNGFKPGDVVWLKCGSCPMCVNDIELVSMDVKVGDKVESKPVRQYECIWTDTRGRLQTAEFFEFNLTDIVPAFDEGGREDEGHICPECDGHGGCCQDEDELRN